MDTIEMDDILCFISCFHVVRILSLGYADNIVLCNHSKIQSFRSLL